MYESVQNNIETQVRDYSNHDQGSGAQASCNVPPNLSGMPSIPPELTSNIGNPNCRQTLVFELMKQIPQVPSGIPPKGDKLADRVAQCNLKSMIETMTKCS